MTQLHGFDMRIIAFFTLLWTGFACSTTHKLNKIDFAKNQVIAHRGAFKFHNTSENSLAALKYAIALGCTGSEFDVRMTQDDSLIVNHDPHFHTLEIEKTTYAELSKHRLSNGEILPTLRQYLAAGLQHNKTTRLIVEIKPSGVPARGEIIAAKVLSLVQEMKAENRVVYISFDYQILKKLRALDPSVKTQYLTGDKSPDEVKIDGITGIDYHFSVFKQHPDWITAAKKHHLELNAWTVNDAETMRWLLVNGFDYITTNEPELLFQIIAPNPDPVQVWTTKADQSQLLSPHSIPFSTEKMGDFPVISIDTTQTFQSIDGFGYTLTGGSAMLINSLPKHEKNALLTELFSNQSNAIGVSYLRVAMGASDLNASVYSYNDLPEGETDVNLTKFSLSQDTIDVIPVLKQVLAINPTLKIMASPWSPPVWMKSNQHSIGGSLLPQYYAVYAQYFVRYIQAMQARGIAIDAITLQNEPHHDGNNPSMLLKALEAADFVKNHLGPAFQKNKITTKIIIWDHNCDTPQYPIEVLNDAAAKPFINGTAFHLYGGDISALSQVHAQHTDKALYFTEQWTGAKSDFEGDLMWHLKNVIIGSMRNQSRIALEWNLANNATYSIHTPKGCDQCKGALTIQDGVIERNVSYYIIGQISKFVPPGSVRVESNQVGALINIAFKTPLGKTVILILNEDKTAKDVTIYAHGKWINTRITAKTAVTLVW